MECDIQFLERSQMSNAIVWWTKYGWIIIIAYYSIIDSAAYKL